MQSKAKWMEYPFFLYCVQNRKRQLKGIAIQCRKRNAIFFSSAIYAERWMKTRENLQTVQKRSRIFCESLKNVEMNGCRRYCFAYSAERSGCCIHFFELYVGSLRTSSLLDLQSMDSMAHIWVFQAVGVWAELRSSEIAEVRCCILVRSDKVKHSRNALFAVLLNPELHGESSCASLRQIEYGKKFQYFQSKDSSSKHRCGS